MLIIYGPTGVGKSDFALSIAKHIPAEIINMDVGQLYVPFSIGTAKPDWRNHPTPHHLFDSINEPIHYTVVDYRKAVLEKIDQIRKRGALPILVGGSGFYLKSLFFPLADFSHVESSCITIESKETLWDTLHTIDPERASMMQPQDTYRIQRALQVWLQTGIKPSLYKPCYNNIFGDYHIIYLTRERSDLYARINQRVHDMFAAGWLEEVVSFLDTPWIPFIEQKKLIGYNEICDYLKHGNTDVYDAMITRIQKRTRVYARRQEIFWRMLSKNITDALRSMGHAEYPISTINLTSSDHAIYLKQLLDMRSSFTKGCLA